MWVAPQSTACKSVLPPHLAVLAPSSLLSQKYVCPSSRPATGQLQPHPFLAARFDLVFARQRELKMDGPDKKTTKKPLKTCWEDWSCPRLSEEAVGCKTEVKPGLNIVYHSPLPNTPKSPVFAGEHACRSRAPGSTCKVTVPAFLPPLPLPWPGGTKAEGKYTRPGTSLLSCLAQASFLPYLCPGGVTSSEPSQGVCRG